MALHFAVRNKAHDPFNARVYIVEPDALAESLELPSDIKKLRRAWKAYVRRHPTYEFKADEWEDAYLPVDKNDLAELKLPGPPLVLEFPRFSRRIAAQRSRFVVFGTDAAYLANELKKPNSTIRQITIASSARATIRQQLRDCGVTESVIYPDLDGLGREIRQVWDDRRAATEGRLGP